MHLPWADLPDQARRAVVAHTGAVRHVAAVGAGSTCSFAATLHTCNGLVFCKGIPTGDRRAWTLRNEIRVSPRLAGIAPALRWHVEQGGWLIAGLAHVPGRHADLRPGSADLPAIAAVLAALAAAPPPEFPVRPFTARWAGIIDPGHIAGRTVAHTDMSRRNWLISSGRARLVDWATPAVGPPWLDTAFTVVRLIRYGHTPAAAETWAAQIPAWPAAPDEALSAFAVAVGRLFRRAQDASPAAHRGALIDATRTWCRYRSGPAARAEG